MKHPSLSAHAIERYRQRVDPAASRQEARAALDRIVSLGHRRSRPRHWMRGERIAPGLRFVYWAGRPEVCLLLLDDVVVTVKTRELFRAEPRHLRPLPRPRREEARWRWDGLLDEAA